MAESYLDIFGMFVIWLGSGHAISLMSQLAVMCVQGHYPTRTPICAQVSFIYMMIFMKNSLSSPECFFFVRVLSCKRFFFGWQTLSLWCCKPCYRQCFSSLLKLSSLFQVCASSSGVPDHPKKIPFSRGWQFGYSSSTVV